MGEKCGGNNGECASMHENTSYCVKKEAERADQVKLDYSIL